MIKRIYKSGRGKLFVGVKICKKTERINNASTSEKIVAPAIVFPKFVWINPSLWSVGIITATDEAINTIPSNIDACNEYENNNPSPVPTIKGKIELITNWL